MPAIPLMPSRSRQTCAISAAGAISLPQFVIQRLGWAVPSPIAISYLVDPLALLFAPAASSDQPSFSLSYQSRPPTRRTGSKLRCSAFAARVLGPRVELPLRGLVPIFLSGGAFPLALVVQGPQWTSEEFSQAGLKRIASDLKGVYQLLGASGTVLRIGEGALVERLRAHLKEDRLAAQVRTIQYFRLADKEETQHWERILIAQYELQNGQLPPLNRIHG